MEKNLKMKLGILRVIKLIEIMILIIEILIVCTIIYAFNNRGNCIDESAQEIGAYNAQFAKYEGIKNGQSVRSMLDTVRNHNLVNSDDVSKQIKIRANEELLGEIVNDNTPGSTSAEITAGKSFVLAGRRYIVTFNYTSTGLIKEIGYVLVGSNLNIIEE